MAKTRPKGGTAFHSINSHEIERRAQRTAAARASKRFLDTCPTHQQQRIVKLRLPRYLSLFQRDSHPWTQPRIEALTNSLKQAYLCLQEQVQTEEELADARTEICGLHARIRELDERLENVRSKDKTLELLERSRSKLNEAIAEIHRLNHEGLAQQEQSLLAEWLLGDSAFATTNCANGSHTPLRRDSPEAHEFRQVERNDDLTETISDVSTAALQETQSTQKIEDAAGGRVYGEDFVGTSEPTLQRAQHDHEAPDPKMEEVAMPNSGADLHDSKHEGVHGPDVESGAATDLIARPRVGAERESNQCQQQWKAWGVVCQLLFESATLHRSAQRAQT